MKKILVSVFILFTIQKATSQSWIALGSDEQTSNSLAMTAAATFFTQASGDGIPYISYIDDVGNGNNLGDFKTHAKRFRNGQWEFAGDGISNQFPGSDNFPVAVDGNIPYVAYNESATPEEFQNKLTVKQLNSNTGLWEVVGQRGLSAGFAGGSTITADNGKIYVAYADGALESKITVKLYDNNNAADGWKTVGAAGFSNGFVFSINIAVDNGVPYVAYLDFADNTLYVKKFNGTAWEDVGSNNPSGGLQVITPSLKFNSQHVPFITYVTANGEGIVRNLNTATNDWVTTGGQSFATGIENSPLSLEIVNNVPFIAFGKKVDGITQIHVKRFDAAENNWPDAGNQPATVSPSAINTVALVNTRNNKLLLVFHNLFGGIYAKTFDAGGVLPVSLTAFTVTRQNGKSLLQWTTESELDNKLFEFEHSADGVKFKKIGEVAAQSPADIKHHYSFTHSLPVQGVNYYRLKQVDKNGSHTYSKIIGITFNQQQLSLITLSPNPAKDILHAANLPAGEKEIIIRNTEGKINRKIKTAATSIDINIAELPAGTYFISLYNEGTIETRSFIK